MPNAQYSITGTELYKDFQTLRKLQSEEDGLWSGLKYLFLIHVDELMEKLKV